MNPSGATALENELHAGIRRRWRSFYNEMLIGQKWRRPSRQSSALCKVPPFVRDDRIMLAIFGRWSGRRLLFLLRADANLFQERLGGLFAAEEFFDRDVDVTRIARLVDFVA